MIELTTQAERKPIRVVVLGAGGFVGSAIVRQLQADGMTVAALTRLDVDLLSADAAKRLIDCLKPGDAIVFVSAIAPVRNPAQFVDNLIMARSVCDAVGRTSPSHVLYVSSDAVYADEPSLVSEASCPRPTGLHGAMHVAREAMLAATVKAPLCILRPTLIYGASDPHNGYGPNRFRRQASAGQDIVLFGGGEEKRDHIAAEDVAALASLCIRHQASGILNAATGRSMAFRDVAEIVAAHAARPVRIVETPRQMAITHRHFDISALLTAFPAFQFIALREGLARAAAADAATQASSGRTV